MQRTRILSSRYIEYFVFTPYIIDSYFMTGSQGSSKFKSSATFPFILSGPNCSGSEQHLIECPGSEIEISTSCSYTSVVHCTGTIYTLFPQIYARACISVTVHGPSTEITGSRTVTILKNGHTVMFMSSIPSLASS